MKERLARFLVQTLSHLAVLAVMLLALCPEAQAFWQCQGRPCGTTAWSCCCKSRINACGQDCISAPSNNTIQTLQTIGHSTDGCHCTVASQDSPQSLKSPSPFFAPPLFVVSVIAPVVHFEVAPDVPLLRPIESRGPPPTIHLATAFLRGPPSA